MLTNCPFSGSKVSYTFMLDSVPKFHPFLWTQFKTDCYETSARSQQSHAKPKTGQLLYNLKTQFLPN